MYTYENVLRDKKEEEERMEKMRKERINEELRKKADCPKGGKHNFVEQGNYFGYMYLCCTKCKQHFKY